MDPKLNKSHHCATRCMDQVSYFLNYCYHITTKCMEHPPLHLHYRMIFTCTLIHKLPKSVLYDMCSPFLSWKLGARQYRPLLRKRTRYHGHCRIGARRIFILKIASERKETGHMKMLTWGLNLLIILMYLKFRQSFCKNRLVWANPDGSSRPRIARRGLARNQTQDFKSCIVRSTYGFKWIVELVI